MLKLLILADDLTGSLDTGVQLVRCGIRTRVTMERDLKPDKQAGPYGALVIDTESRHLPPDEAYRIVHRIVSAAVGLGVEHIYKKTDSALRGNVGAELAAAADAAGVRPLPFAPAWPENGRTTRDGIHYVYGTPLALSDFAGDVLDPIGSSDVGEILRSTASCRASAVGDGDGPWPADADILIFDAQTGAQMDAIGVLLRKRGALRLTAGCARLIQSLAPYFGSGLPDLPCPGAVGSGRTLLACGSMNEASLRQTAFAVRELGYAVVLPDGDPCSGMPAEIPSGKDSLVLRSSCANTYEDVRQYLDAIPREFRSLKAHQVAGCMGRRVRELMDRTELRTLIVFGGDTLFSVIRSLEIPFLEPVAQVAEGAVLCRIVYRGRELNLVTKAGSFGGENLVQQIETSLSNGSDS